MYIYIYINSRTSLITVIANKIMTIHGEKKNHSIKYFTKQDRN